MSDPMYTSDLFIDGLTIKSEPMSIDNLLLSAPPQHTASMPIPSRRTGDFSDLKEGFEFAEVSPSSSSYQDTNYTVSSLYSGTSVWSPRSEPEVKMEDDDIFQVDKADLIQGPTLAELNANDETLLDDLSFDDLLIPEGAYTMQLPTFSRGISPTLTPQLTPLPPPIAMSFPPDSGSGAFYREYSVATRNRLELSPGSHHSSASSVAQQELMVSPPLPDSGGVSPTPTKVTLQDLLRTSAVSPTTHQAMGQSVPGRYNGTSVSGGSSAGSTSSSGAQKRSHASRLSSSAPTHLGLEQIWARREPRQHLLSTGSMAEATSTSSITSGILSPEGHDFSLDECFDSEEDSDHEPEYSSDDDSNSEGEDGAKSSRSAKKERFFWQYNVQAKGPKGQRLVLKTKQEDPHRLNEITDPVFSPQCSLQGIKHSGKARKGDGNDLTPNPRKLQVIGKELDKLNKSINDMTPVSELPFTARPDTRKEKNKLASRACRLKKKAQHEANKIKLYGLESEHKRLMTGIAQMKNHLVSRMRAETPPDPAELKATVDKIVKSATKMKVAGNTTEFVNKVLEKMKQGVANGGLDDFHYSN